ncbi:hypothetical protein ACG04Q_18830 [Roseateles sp. DXS20W]|uniref:Uncharacterized protein n=1 Tax=Pelomonas lactea TaxID=3299030 RepID=A0ABW7GP70_9BURK
MRTLMTTVAAGAASLALVACGGGGGDSGGPAPGPAPMPTPQTAVPDSAITSSDAFVGYLNTRPTGDETGDALTLPAAEPFTSETEEPYAI